MKLPQAFRLALAVCAAALGLAPLAAAYGMTDDPFIRQNIHRQNFEPRGKFHLLISNGAAPKPTPPTLTTANRAAAIPPPPAYATNTAIKST